jgi:hypothetical protein
MMLLLIGVVFFGYFLFCFVEFGKRSKRKTWFIQKKKKDMELCKIKITCNDAMDWLVIFDVKRHLYTMNYLKYGR